jgi:hypothetical protein
MIRAPVFHEFAARQAGLKPELVALNEVALDGHPLGQETFNR